MYLQQCLRGWEERPVQITGAQLCCIYCVFLGSVIICRLYMLTLSQLSHVTLQLTVSLSYIVQRSFSQSALAEGGWGNFFTGAA